MILALNYLITIILGLILGSFATAVTYRELNGISWSFDGARKNKTSSKRSICPLCKVSLTARDLIPIVSWCMNKGRCRHCSAAISISYPMIEMLSLALCMAVFVVHGLSLTGITIMLIIPFLIALIIVDLKKMLLPNSLVAIVGGIGLAMLLTQVLMGAQPFSHLFIHIASALGYGFFVWLIGVTLSFILKKEALGMGDVKFFVVAGLWLGPMALAPFCFLSGIIGIMFGLAWRSLTKSSVFPFGPALIVSFFMLLLIEGSFLLQFIL